MVSLSSGREGSAAWQSGHLHEELLSTLQERQTRGASLDGLRCGTRICELLTDLDARGLIGLTTVAEKKNCWTVDVDLTPSSTR